MARRIALSLALGIALSGCGSLQPMNPTEFRQAVSGSSLATVENFDAARPYQQVVDTLRKKANECLAVRTTSSGTVFQGNMAMREQSHAVYKPTVSATDQKMELAVQVDFGEHTTIQKKPVGGFYIVVVDATPAGAAGSRLTLYRGNLGKAKEIAAAIRSWATGASSTCPDLNG